MLRSLRARLAFLFVGTLLLATVLAGVVIVSLYQSYSRDQAVNTLKMQVDGVANYYNRAFNRAYANNPDGKAVVVVRPKDFEAATAAHLYYSGPQLFPTSPTDNPNPALGNIPKDTVTTLQEHHLRVVRFTPLRGTDKRKFIGVAAPVASGGVGGARKPLTDVNNAWKNVSAWSRSARSSVWWSRSCSPPSCRAGSPAR